jgi:hypothetical protein
MLMIPAETDMSFPSALIAGNYNQDTIFFDSSDTKFFGFSTEGWDREGAFYLHGLEAS